MSADDETLRYRGQGEGAGGICHEVATCGHAFVAMLMMAGTPPQRRNAQLCGADGGADWLTEHYVTMGRAACTLSPPQLLRLPPPHGVGYGSVNGGKGVCSAPNGSRHRWQPACLGPILIMRYGTVPRHSTVPQKLTPDIAGVRPAPGLRDLVLPVPKPGKRDAPSLPDCGQTLFPLPPSSSLFLPLPPSSSLFLPLPPSSSLFFPLSPSSSLFLPLLPSFSVWVPVVRINRSSLRL